MTTNKRDNLNRLMRNWPPGTVAVQLWLTTLGISPNLSNWYLKAGWMESIGQGAYKRPGDSINWPGGLYAIQKHLKKNIHVGAKSALELLGYGHYVRLGSKGHFYFFGEPRTHLPSWFEHNKLWDVTVNYFTPSLFKKYKLGLIEKNFSNIPLIISGQERAVMETLHLIPKHQSLDEACLLMQGMNNLRPQVVQELLEECQSIKVKRLFMHLAELHQLSFLKYISTEKINFGKGKRVIDGGGSYHAKYQLSLPIIKEGE